MAEAREILGMAIEMVRDARGTGRNQWTEAELAAMERAIKLLKEVRD